jgi:hypothetical protein
MRCNSLVSHSLVRAAMHCWVVTMLVATATGCATNEKQTYPTKGKLVWEDGGNAKQLAGGMVVFQSDQEQISAKGAIDDTGSFVLGTFALDDGAVAGPHKVVIIPPASETGDYNSREIVDRRYERVETTDLAVTIEAQPNDVVLKLRPGAWTKKQQLR